MKKLLFQFFIFGICCAVYPQNSQMIEQNLEGLETLLFMEVPIVMGTLTQSQADKTPVSVTTIEKEKIALAPVRNLYDLLEMFVPGFQYTTSFDCPHMGLRGLIVDRDYTWLLLVNGRLVNQKSHAGVVTEMENWDLNDIEKVEVIRGPGSVTYGPGAVAGVISLTTKNASVVPEGSNIGVNYVSGYDSKGLNVSNSIVKDNWGLYTYASITKTEGYEDSDIFAFSPPSREARYVEPMAIQGNSYVSPVTEYYADYDEQEQVKFYTELNFLKEFKIWGRYVNSGSSRIVCWTDETTDSRWFYQRRNNDGDWQNTPCSGVRQYVLAAENNHVFTDSMSLKSTISYSSIDQERVDTDLIQTGGYVENYSENDFLLKTTLKYDFSEKIKSAFGFEYAYDKLDKGWGDSDDEFIMDDGVLFLAYPGSPAYAARNWIGTDQQIYLTNYDMYNYAFLGEINISLTDTFDVMLSGRADKYEFSEISYSPRLSFIYNHESAGLFKFNIQRSIRENSLIQLASADYYGNESPDQEEFDGMEFVYSKKLTPQTSCELAIFYSDADLLGWNAQGGEEAGSVRTTARTGFLTLGGVDLTLEYKSEDERYALGFSHAFAKQLDFELSDETPGSYISRSDSNDTDYEGIRRLSTGNDRMNWANNVTKLYTIMKITEKLTVFNSMRITWEYEGNKNWMEMYRKGAAGTEYEETVNANIKRMEDKGIFDTDFRFDLSVSYKITEPWIITLYGQNLIKFTDNWRYVYIMEGGAAIEEPTVVGLKTSFSF